MAGVAAVLAVRRMHAQRQQQQQANNHLRYRMQDLSRNHYYAVGARPLLPENHMGMVVEHRSPRTIENSRKAQERYLLLLSFPTEVTPKEAAQADHAAECAICLAGFEPGDKVKTLPCFHRYHSRCLRTWFEQENLICPTCRFDCVNGRDDEVEV